MEAEIARAETRVQGAHRQTRILAFLVAGVGAINVGWIAAPGWRILAALGNGSPFFIPSIEPLQAFFAGLGLLFLAWGLWRGKRYAWLAALGLAAPLAALYALDGAYLLKLLGAAGLTLGLWAARRSFTTRSDPAAVRRGLELWALGLAASLALSVFTGPADAPLSTWLNQVLLSALGGFVLSLAPVGGWLAQEYGGLLTGLHFGLGLASWGGLFWLLDRPLPAPPVAASAGRARAAEIVRAWGRTSQAHLALLDDKTYYFSPGGSVIAYTVQGRWAVTLGDPIGPLEDAPAAIRAFVAFAARSDWWVVFSLTTSDYLPLYRRLGFGALCLGHEGIIDLPNFSLKGNASKTFRKRYNRLAALGYRVDVYDPPIDAGLLADLRRVSDEWLAMAQAPEKRFFLACFTEDYVRSERVAVVRAPGGVICAFANLVPEYQLNELSIDLMRRRRQIEPGVMDFLFVSLFLWAREHGYQTFNLGLSPLFGVGGRPGSSWLEVVIYYLYEHGTFYDFKGLNGFKIKFRPSWSPQYLVYPSLLSLPVAGLALARANAGRGETLLDYFRPRHKPMHHEF